MKNVVNVSEAQKWISQISLVHSMFRDSKFKKKKREWKNSWKQIQMELACAEDVTNVYCILTVTVSTVVVL